MSASRPDSSDSTPPRFGDRYGCFVVVLVLAALLASLVWAVRHPAVGVPAVLVIVAVALLFMRHATRREREEQAHDIARLKAVAPPVGDAWHKLLEAEGLGAHVEPLRSLVRPALRLVATPSQAGAPIGQSRIGGSPDLPPELAWPVHQGKPLAFLAQLDLAELRRTLPHSPLPPDGYLWFFHGADQPWGFDPKDAGSSLVLYRPGAPSLERRADPADLPDGGRFNPCAIRVEAYDDLPDLDEHHPLDPGLSEAQEEQYLAVRDYLSSGGAGPSHKVLGYAQPIQGPMELECELVTHGLYCGDPTGYADPRAKELEKNRQQWRLLFQLDSDEAAAMMWGDVGRVYFWIRDEDLRQHRFERTWTILQCH